MNFTFPKDEPSEHHSAVFFLILMKYRVHRIICVKSRWWWQEPQCWGLLCCCQRLIFQSVNDTLEPWMKDHPMNDHPMNDHPDERPP